jgi:hypothetical protein
MTTHADAFSKALSNIQPQREEPGDDAANAKLAHEAVRQALDADTKLERWGLQTELIGSYARAVSIRRVKDVDVFCKLTSLPGHLSPGEVLDHLEQVVVDQYGDDAERQHRSVKIEFPDWDLSVDAVPARPDGDAWQVPSRVDARHKWLATNPLLLNELTRQMNGRDDYKINDKGVYVRVVKLMRQVRRARLDTTPPGGLFLELMTYAVFAAGLPSQKTYADYLTATLEGVSELFADVVDNGLDDPTIDGAKISTKASQEELEAAAANFAQAADLARQALDEEDECESARMWARLLGDNCDGPVFPVPSYCDGESARVAGAPAFIPSRTSGSQHAPERPGRFA